MFFKLSVFVLLAANLAVGEIKNKGWYKNMNFYQVYPRSFMDSNGDGIGDVKGITNKLEHFVESGIGGIWLSPVFASPMVDFGYDISDYRNVDSIFGTTEDLEALTQKAKQLGIRVVLDFVPNHTSDQHDWFIQSVNGNDKYKDYYTWQEGKNNNTEPPNNWISVFSGPAWKFNEKRQMWYLHQFHEKMPDLNFTNPDVQKELEDILKFWLDKGVDGFRIDAANFIIEADGFPDEPPSNKPEFLQTESEFNKHIYTKDDPRNYDLVRCWRKVVDDWADLHNDDEKLIMVEAYSTYDDVAKYYKYGSQIPFNFFFLTNINDTSKASDYKEVIDNWMQRLPQDEAANWVMGNHDRKRISTRFPGRADQMVMLSMVLPGVAVTYYGEEIGMLDHFDISWEITKDPQACNTSPERYQIFTRDPARTPFQWDDTLNSGFSTGSTTWLPIHSNYKELNLLKQKSQEQSKYKLYQALTKLRTTEVLKSGTLSIEILNENKILAVIRKISKEAVVLLINFSDDSAQTANMSEYLTGFAQATIVTASTESNIKWGSSVHIAAVELPAKTSLVFVART